MQIPSNEIQRIAALQRYRLLDTPSEAAFDDFAQLSSIICGTPMALVSLIDTHRQWIKACVGVELVETAREHAFCAHTILGEDPLIVEDAHEDDRFSGNPYVTAAPHIRFYAGTPLIDSQGHALGSLCVLDLKPRVLSAGQMEALQLLGARVMAHIELRTAAEQLATSLEDVKILAGLVPICAHCKDIRDDAGFWQQLETYMQQRSEARFSHGICPECLVEHYSDLFPNGVPAELLEPAGGQSPNCAARGKLAV